MEYKTSGTRRRAESRTELIFLAWAMSGLPYDAYGEEQVKIKK
jgi:hypothetical protein